MKTIGVADLRSRIAGCWMGKNIGGTLGAPFEGKRGAQDLTFYTQDLKGRALPNDDLDLQLVWLLAVEKYGRGVNASILGEYWHSFIVPNWSEYGMGMNNMRMGLVPPLSGWVNNLNRDSCGAYIRSELWACLAPGHPELAVRYAYEDAIVDHSEEGVYGEIFCAAVQSAAFVEADKFRLIEMGLSYIPAESGMAKGIRCVVEAFRAGKTWKEARTDLLKLVPDAFYYGYLDEQDKEPELPRGRTGYDAPANVGIFVLGWLFGEDDFGKSVCISAGCGEDTDCTAGTLGATLGIIHGIEGIPASWKKPIGEGIFTVSVNLGDQGHMIAKTVGDLTERVLQQIPRFMNVEDVNTLSGKNGYTVNLKDGEALYCADRPLFVGYSRSFQEEVLARQPFSVRYENPLYTAWLEYGAEPVVLPDEPFHFTLHFENALRKPQWLTIRWHLPEGWAVEPGVETSFSLTHNIGGWAGIGKAEYTIIPGETLKAREDLHVDIRSEARHTRLVIPITLLNRTGTAW